MGVYLYCLSRPGCVAALSASSGDVPQGIDERFPVVVIEDVGIAAVIGDIDLADFSDENLQSLAWVGPRAMRHEAVVQRVMGASVVLPVKFGTIFASRRTLVEFLETHRVKIDGVLSELTGRAEWSVKGYVVDAEARQMIIEQDPAILARLASLSPTPGLRYVQQKQLEPRIDSALRDWLRQTTSAVQERLAQRAVAWAQLRCHASNVTGRADRMVFNCSFLLDPAALGAFEAEMEEQRRNYSGAGLTFELKGPWPPYNFCAALSETTE